MPRIRSLKPEIASDVKLSRVSIPAAYTFVLMITQADDLGLLPGAHRQILGILYPLREDVSVPLLLGWIEELTNEGMVRWLETRDGVPVLQLVNWRKHQRIDNAGRSQLGPLLADPAGVSAASESESAEARGGSRRIAATRRLDQRPTTKDLGSPTTDQVPTTGAAEERSPVLQAAVALAREANRGLAEHPTHPQPIPPIIASGGNSHQAAEAILAAGVPIEFAAARVYELARSHRAGGQVNSLRYFVSAVVRAWEEHQAAADVAAHPPAAGTAAHDDPYVLAARQLKEKEAAHG